MKLSFLSTSLLALATSVLGQQKGFNYGALNADGTCSTYQNFHNKFTRARGLVNAPGFTSARLYTSIQCGSTNAPIEAIKAALDTQTNLLLGVWASAGQATVDNEIIALKQAANLWPNKMRQRVVGISVGSEDLYRSSPQGVANEAGVGADAQTVVRYIRQVRSALRGTALEGVRVGHVDTWTAWVLPENAAVINSVDWLGHNSFPYFETTRPNAISQAKANFDNAVGETERVAGGKPVWVTETGWPVQGPTSGSAVASPQNAKTYWNQVGCGELFGKRNVWWYTLYSANSAQTDITFAVVNPDRAQGQKFNLACPA